MQTTEPAVCNMGMFGSGSKQFWMGELNGLLEKFPALEYPHKQDFYTLVMIDTADGEIIIDNHKIRLDRAKAIIIKPRCISSIDINRLASGIIICFTEDFFSLRYNNNVLYQFSFLQREQKPFVRLSQDQKEHWNTLLRMMGEEFGRQKIESKKVIRSYLNILLFELERLYNVNSIRTGANRTQEKVHAFEILIDTHFRTRKLPSAYAELLNVSAGYLNRVCKAATGYTAGYLIRKRITIEAQRLLYYTNLSVNEIADRLGFENTSYFVTFFKKQTELTPEQFRRNQDT